MRPFPLVVPVVAVMLALASLALASACESFGAGRADGGADGGNDGATEVGRDDGAPSCDPMQTATDVHHCGACGHDCLGGGCAAGKCQPVVVGRTTGRILDLAVNASHVVWMVSETDFAAATVYACPKAGCVGPPLVVKRNGVSGSLAGDGTNAYATFVFTVHEFFKIEGAAAKHVDVPSSHGAIERLQVRPEAVYSLAFYEPTLPDGGASSYRSVYAWDGGTESLVGSYNGPNTNVTSFVVTKERVYLNSVNADELYTCLKSNCDAFTPLSIGSYTLGGLQTDDTRVYWMASDGLLRACEAGATCNPTVLGDVTNGRALAVGPDTLFLGTTVGDLRSCDPRDCTTTSLVFHDPGFTESVQVPPSAIGRVIAYDKTAVYWAAIDEGGQGVWRVMKLAR